MRTLVYGDDERCIEWAERVMEGCKFREDAKAIGIERDGKLLATTVFDTFSRTSCFVHVVSDNSKRWMTHEFIVHVFAYPFIQCGFKRINCIVEANNVASLAMIRKFGWVQEGRLRQDADDGGDVLVFGMLRRECRWLPPGTGLLTPSAV